MLIVTDPTDEESTVLDKLLKLRFRAGGSAGSHGGGRIAKFFMQGNPGDLILNHRSVWGSFHEYLAAQNPQFLVKHDLLEGGYNMARPFFMQSIAVVPVYVSEQFEGRVSVASPSGDGSTIDVDGHAPTKKVKLMAVYHVGENTKRNVRHWSFLTGDLHLMNGRDDSIYGAAQNVWQESLGQFYGWEWERIFKPLPSSVDTKKLQETYDGFYVNHEKQEAVNPKYPVRPYLFLEVTQEFYEYTDAQLNCRIPSPPPKNANFPSGLDYITLSSLTHSSLSR